MLSRDLYLSSMAGMADLRCPHPANAEGGKMEYVPRRIDSTCKYIHLMSKLTLDESDTVINGGFPRPEQ